MRIFVLDRRGMTLIEVLVAGMIGVIVAGVVVVIYLMYNTQIRESETGFSLQMRYGNVSAQIASHARAAHKILPSGESYTDACQSSEYACPTVLFYDAAGIPHAGIGISSDTLYEWREDGGELVRSVFDAGNGPVLVDPASSFTLNGCRNAITTDLRVKQLDGDIAVYTDPLREVFRCRN